jgi:hypothetical protein
MMSMVYGVWNFILFHWSHLGTLDAKLCTFHSPCKYLPANSTLAILYPHIQDTSTMQPLQTPETNAGMHKLLQLIKRNI